MNLLGKFCCATSEWSQRAGTFIATLFVPFLIIGCTPHSVNLNPEPSVTSASYSEPSEPLVISAERIPWWQKANDPVLRDLIELSLSQNPSLEQARQRVVQADAILVQARGIRLPSIALGADTNLTLDQDSDFTSRSGVGGLVAWDPDLFGRLKSGNLARVFEVEARREEYELSKLILSRSVAETYLAAIAQSSQIALLKKQIDVDRELLELVESSFQAGVVSRVDVLQQKGQLADTEARLPLAELTYRIFENRLDLLLGSIPDGLNRIQEQPEFPEIYLPSQFGVPSDLLLNRPDLRAQRAILVAADAEIGSAIADRLPSINLDGSSFFSGGNDSATGFVTNIAGALFQPVLDWGVRKAEVERNQALYRERLAEFTYSYLTAIEEVENLIYQVKRQAEYLHKLKLRGDILTQTLEETRKSYSSGLIDYLPVLDALKDLRDIERDTVEQRRVLLTYYIQLFVSLGGLQPEVKQVETQTQSGAAQPVQTQGTGG